MLFRSSFARHFGALALGASLAACTDPVADDQPAAVDPATDVRIPQEGEWGKVTMQTEGGPVELSYRVERGHAIFQGDVDLGPVEALAKHARGGAVTDDLGARWPNGKVRFRFESGLNSSIKMAIQSAIQHWEDMTPLAFVEVSQDAGGDFIEFRRADDDANYAGVSDSIGMDGGEQVIEIKLDTSVNQNMRGTAIHEIGHAVGLWHEQARRDRNSFVTIKLNCIQDSQESQFDIQNGSLDLGPYDVGSIMHYNGFAFCDPKAGLDVSDIKSKDDCKCATIIDDATGMPVASQRNGLSIEDVNTVHRLYDQSLGVDEAGDRFGAALAAGDFDGDGYQDLASGVPGENGTGMVMVMKGDGLSLSWWHTLNQPQLGGSAEAFDRFGGALAAGDFDNDGFDDLAVGVNGEDVDGVIDAGAVFVYKGSATGLKPWKILTQTVGNASLNMVADAFGSALVAGDFDNDGRDELAIGAPLDASAANQPRAGAVFVYEVSSGVWVFKNKLAQTAAQNVLSGDRFGIALAAGKLDTQAGEDLVVGSPEDGSSTKGPGTVFVYRQGKTFWTTLAQPAGTSPANGDQFGLAVAIGDVDLNYRVDVIVGAPNKFSGKGRVFWFRGDANEPFGPDGFYAGQWFSQSALASDEAGDRFGCKIIAGRIDGDALDDLVITACGEDVGTAADAGAVFIYRGQPGAPVGWKLFLQKNAVWGLDEANDHFGESLALVDADGDGDVELAVGAPDEAPETGIVFNPTQGPAAAGGLYLFGDDAQPFSTGFPYFQHSEYHE